MSAFVKILSVSFAVSLLLACSSGSSDDDDGSGTIDAAPGGNIDAAQTADAAVAASGVGATCDGTAGQADCPADHICLTFTGGTNPWCTKQCTNQQDTSCAAGYTGPGLSVCALTVVPPEGADFMACTILCRDTTENICDAATCDGTCPGTLTCTVGGDPTQSFCI